MFSVAPVHRNQVACLVEDPDHRMIRCGNHLTADELHAMANAPRGLVAHGHCRQVAEGLRRREEMRLPPVEIVDLDPMYRNRPAGAGRRVVMIRPMTKPEAQALVTAWADAPVAIGAAVRRLGPAAGTAVVGISGPVGSGKSSLAARLAGSRRF